MSDIELEIDWNPTTKQPIVLPEEMPIVTKKSTITWTVRKSSKIRHIFLIYLDPEEFNPQILQEHGKKFVAEDLFQTFSESTPVTFEYKVFAEHKTAGWGEAPGEIGHLKK